MERLRRRRSEFAGSYTRPAPAKGKRGHVLLEAALLLALLVMVGVWAYWRHASDATMQPVPYPMGEAR
jgi:hypothetical protein